MHHPPESASRPDEVSVLKERLAWFEKQVYGQKSEKTEVILENSEQLHIFDEAEQTADVNLKNPEYIDVKASKRVKRTRDEIYADMEVEEVVHEAADKICDRCGSEMVVIGKEKIRDELVYVPARMFLRRHIAEVVKCTACGMDESRDADLPDIEPCHIRTAEVPAPMIPHSFCTPELLAHIAYEKYCKAVPLTRLEKDFKAKGVNLSSTTMANWIIMASQRWLKPVCDQMHRELVTSSVIHADETVVQVLHEPGKKAKTDSRMWVYCNGKVDGKNNILFDYQPTRNGDHAARFLGDYSGYIVCDGYDAYNKLKKAFRCGCWAHVRRKFVDALPGDKDLLPTSAAAKGVEYCNQLFLLERKYSGRNEKDEQIAPPMSSEERHNARQVQSKPVLEAFYAWLDTVEPAGGSNLAKAVQYAKNEKKYLCRFLESGDIPIDNNRAENAVRPMCVGRRNWLFSASVKGAEASAMMYSVAATACANGMKVEEYLTELFRSQPGTLVMPW
ncbi:MAG: IS66 family transposase [Ruminococcaceae bacterium]|nr:IS66 family transposase [Oscillospiraceae bacterium]